jgi:hypothetical protein
MSGHGWLERIDVLAKLALSLAGLLLSGAIGFATIRNNQQAAQRQIQSQDNALALQRRVTARLLFSGRPRSNELGVPTAGPPMPINPVRNVAYL